MLQKDNVYFGPTGIVMRKNSPIVPSISTVVTSLFESGVIDMLFGRNLSSR